MRLSAFGALLVLCGISFAACGGTDGSVDKPVEMAQSEEDIKACPYDPPACAKPCRLDHRCPRTCHCPGGGTPCGTHVCSPNQTCCSGMPFPEPTCINGDICPISRARFKTDIEYVGASEMQRLHDELMSFRLATYRYKTEEPGAKPHLGFLIDDVAPSASVDATGERVDLYGYTSMAVAALKTQRAEIDDLREELRAVRRELQGMRAACSAH